MNIPTQQTCAALPYPGAEEQCDECKYQRHLITVINAPRSWKYMVEEKLYCGRAE